MNIVALLLDVHKETSSFEPQEYRAHYAEENMGIQAT